MLSTPARSIFFYRYSSCCCAYRTSALLMPAVGTVLQRCGLPAVVMSWYR